MLNSNFFKNCLICFIASLSMLMTAGSALAEDGGQIININQGYQIAFTDLGNRALKQGDLVKIFLNTDEFVYMQVLESSAILSKLGASQVENFRTNLKDFARLAVGNKVIKVNQLQESVPVVAPESIVDAKSNVELSQQQIQKLEHDLSLAKEQIRILQESNEAAKASLNELTAQAQSQIQIKKEEALPKENTMNKEVLDQLRMRIDRMHKIIDENN